MDVLSKIRRSENMRRIRSQDTKPEMLVRSVAYRLGYRYRLHVKNLPGKPDLVFTSRKCVIFVQGCFWHQHSECREGRPPKSRQDYWIPKLKRNVERDQTSIALLTELGWRVLVLWECEISDATNLAEILVNFLS
jgi:DNA mismatch endonuclease (patch repair protein)